MEKIKKIKDRKRSAEKRKVASKKTVQNLTFINFITFKIISQSKMNCTLGRRKNIRQTELKIIERD